MKKIIIQLIGLLISLSAESQVNMMLGTGFNKTATFTLRGGYEANYFDFSAGFEHPLTRYKSNLIQYSLITGYKVYQNDAESLIPEVGIGVINLNDDQKRLQHPYYPIVGAKWEEDISGDGWLFGEAQWCKTVKVNIGIIVKFN